MAARWKCEASCIQEAEREGGRSKHETMKLTKESESAGRLKAGQMEERDANMTRRHPW